MKWATVQQGETRFIAQVDVAQGAVRALRHRGQVLRDMQDFIARHEAIGHELELADEALALQHVHLLAPIPRPRRNILGIGMNYRSHFEECRRASLARGGPDLAMPAAPIVFTKMPETVVGPGAPIAYPHGVSTALDYEGELAVVIGRGGKHIAVTDAMQHVFGYTIVNDLTARDVQDAHKQWFLGKSLDTFCPMGPYLVSAEDVDVAALAVKCWVNGELRQRGHTGDLIFSVAELIHHISKGMTLLPGDVITTGTPAGVGMGFEPPRYLRPGDIVEIEISGMGRLVNRVA